MGGARTTNGGEGIQKYLAYSFLYDDPQDLRCDFEIATDEIASMIGLLASLIQDGALRGDLNRLNELMYHINPSLRTKTAVTGDELDWLRGRVGELQERIKEGFDRAAPSRAGAPRFVVPQGCTAACYSHIIRNKCKALVRLLYRCREQGVKTEPILFHFINLYSGYFYSLALKLNQDEGAAEIPFTSRVYS
ncbi:MAG: ATP--cob(I)alamin adenosyltransferase [Treponema sp.]|jgi:cob(I)alamin adenosyltransferase|nr:ATP--cob(I)alamin adenosyltransferase [Treponema sp.]